MPAVCTSCDLNSTVGTAYGLTFPPNAVNTVSSHCDKPSCLGNASPPARKPRSKPSWQGIVFAIGGLYFAVALVPAILSQATSIPLASSLPTAGFLALYAVALWTMKMRWGAFGSALTSAAWFAIAAKGAL